MKAYVQCVPERVDYVQQSMMPVTLQCLSIRSLELFVDADRRGPLWNMTRILEAHRDDGPMLLLQDDLIFHPYFSKALDDILQHVQRGRMNAVSLFAPPRKHFSDALLSGFAFYQTSRNFLWMQAMIFSGSFAAGLLAYCHEQQEETKHDDVVVGRFAERGGIPIFTCLPSIVQHNIEMKSTMGTGAAVGGVKRESRLWTPSIPIHNRFGQNARIRL